MLIVALMTEKLLEWLLTSDKEKLVVIEYRKSCRLELVIACRLSCRLG